jgi:hypothetical protein
MNKLAYALGSQEALRTLKIAAPNTMIGMTRGQSPTWGLGGQTPGGFATGQRPIASTQAGATPGGPPQLQGAPTATPPTRGGPSPSTVAPMPNPVMKGPGASGITPPLQAADAPGSQPSGIPSSNPGKMPGTKLDAKGDVGSVIGATGGKPF